MKNLIFIILALAFSFATAQEKKASRSILYKEETKDVDRIVKLMGEECMALQFALIWANSKHDENDSRRMKFEDEVQRKFLTKCKSKDIDKFEEKSRLNYDTK